MKTKKLKTRLVKEAVMLYCMAVLFLSRTQVAYAGEFGKSKLATGTKDLITDITTWLLILIPVVGGMLALYFFLRKNAANEQEQHIWDKRLKIDGICIIGGTVASSIIAVIVSYYK